MSCAPAPAHAKCHTPLGNRIHVLILIFLHHKLPIVVLVDVEAEHILWASYRLIHWENVHRGRGAAAGGAVGRPFGANVCFLCATAHP